ncbi:hypothetical protein NLI96_g7526 [Meripilus lineatus]|uniref:Uncharacterized protein n=1 Tax=Meripilus lineatus TaxID=2056292 RepID=A0AAD5YEU9_9APHY|nr:hypothetical protein NLI96_g7526 [Physisporinus lineatus]
MNSIIPNDYDWGFNTGSSIMDLDVDNKGRITGSSLSDPSTAATSNAKKLEFVDVDSEALGLSGLDISFDAKASQDGKIRVRIHPQATSSSTASSTAASSPAPHSESEDQLMYPGTDASGTTDSVSSSDHMLSSDYDPLGPFLGIGSNDYGFGSFSGMSVDSLDSLSSSSFDFRSSFDDGFGSSTSASSGRRRVRIALKSLPGQGSEGGEWEVQVC